MRIIRQEEVQQLLTMENCIAVLESALISLAKGTSMQYLRNMYTVEDRGMFATMPGQIKDKDVVGVKIITIFPDNHHRNLPSHQGLVTLFDAQDGRVKAVMDGQSITAIRTAAASAVATKILAKPDAHVLAMIGTGEQAQSHLEAMLNVRPIDNVLVYGRNSEKATVFKEAMEQKYGISVTVCRTVEDAVKNADIICTVTAATTPILEGNWVKPGVHINAVGACRPTDRELDTDLVVRSKLYTDRRESAENEAGDYLIPLQEGAIERSHLRGELGDLLLQKLEGRTSDADITLFESLGIGIQDLASAEFIYQEALRQGVGQEVDL